MSHLVSYYSQIEPNLRRTAKKGLISLLNQQQLEELAFKYFGIKDEYGNITGYQCPYSGKVYTNYKDIVLEHIVPVASKGGTALFNCIPTSKDVNGADQKGAKHLISWWTSSSYWDKEAPLRLEKIVNYMLDGYDQVFKEYTIEEVESSYLDIETDESILGEEDNTDINARTESEQLEQAKNNGIHSQLGFILDCINTLEKCNINTSNIKARLQQLQEQNIFKDIDKYQLYQNIIQKLVVSRIGDNNSSYLTYTLNFDIKKLMDSINLDNEQDIFNELNRRLQNIEQLLKENNLSTIEYFKSLKDIPDIDILYKNNPSQEDIKIFLENIKIGIETKIDIFIEMLNKGNNKIIKQCNQETLEGYPNIKLKYFWSSRKERIKQKLFMELKNHPGYDTARKLIAINEMTINVENQIPIFIEMLNKGNSSILKKGNQETLEGYPNIKLAQFWNNHKKRIKQKLFVELKNNPGYDTARKLIAINEVENNLDAKIDIFIEMLNKGNSSILKRGNQETLEGYPYIKLAQFWHSHQEKIKQKLFVELKDDPKYDVARKLIAINEVENNLDAKIDIFIEMLNKGNSLVLNRGNNETLEGYPNINLSSFWRNHKERIKQKLFVELKDNPDYDTARKLIEVNNVENNLDTKIDIFIEMLNKGNNKIIKQCNQETLEGYPNIKLSYFWNRHQDKVKQKLFVELKTNSRYDTARKLIVKNEMIINVDKQILIFIEMLNKGNNKILKQGNKETLAGYPDISLSTFWNRNKERINQKLFVELKDNAEYDTARELITINEMQINVDNQIPIFIEMLNKGNNNILNSRNKETLEGYPNIKLAKFWNNHKERIKQKLFVELKDNAEYDTARELIRINEVENNIEVKISIFIKMLNKGNSKILKQGNKEMLEGYSNINLSKFWHNNQTKIKQKLFDELKDNPEYDIARQTVLTYFNVTTYEELEAKQNKGKKLKEVKEIKQQLEKTIEDIDKIDLTIQEQRKRA